MQAFQILLQIGAGTGLIFLLRWYWWRINAWGEIAAMVISFLVAVYFHFGHARLGFAPLHPMLALVIGVMITTLGWLAMTLLTPPTDTSVLQSFYNKIRPAPAGWRGAVDTSGGESSGNIAASFLAWFLGCLFFTRHCLRPAICSMAVPRLAFPAPQSPWLRLLASGELYPKLAFGRLEPPL